MEAAAEVQTRSLALDVQKYAATTAFTITYTTMNMMPVKAAIVVTYPPSAVFSEPLAPGLFLDGVWRPATAALDTARSQIIVQLLPPADPS